MANDLAEIRGAMADASFGIYRSLQVAGCLGDFNPDTRVAVERIARSHLTDLLLRLGVLVPADVEPVVIDAAELTEASHVQ